MKWKNRLSNIKHRLKPGMKVLVKTKHGSATELQNHFNYHKYPKQNDYCCLYVNSINSRNGELVLWISYDKDYNTGDFFNVEDIVCIIEEV